MALAAKYPGEGGTEGEGQGCERGGETQGSEAGAGEIEEMGHGERVVSYAAMGEEVADVGDEGEAAGAPETVGQGDGDGEADDGKGGVADDYPAAGRLVFVVEALGAHEGGAEEDEEWEIGGEGVVLLVGGDGEEDQDESRKKNEDERGLLR